MSYFFDGLDEAAPAMGETISAAEIRLCTALRRLSPRQQRKLYELVMTFAEVPKPLVNSH